MSMSIPTFHFTRCDGSKPERAREFIAAVLATGRFWRSDKSQIKFKVAPGDYCLVERRHDLQSIIEDGEVLRLTGALDEAAWLALWTWLNASKWKLPLIGGTSATVRS
jgi:hypothetical protein